MVFPESVLVVLASTLAGGIQRVPPDDDDDAGAGNASCGLGTRWQECHVLDERIRPPHLVVPWCITLCTVVILSMPTVLLRSRFKERGLRTFAGNLFQCLGLLLCSSFLSDHPSICFALTIHSSVRLLVQMEVSDALLGGCVWWGLRYVSVLAILFLQVTLGPSLSVVRWPTTPAGTALPCAYLAHLAGCIIPDLALACMRCLVWAARYVRFREE
jgi:hypothetical protein